MNLRILPTFIFLLFSISFVFAQEQEYDFSFIDYSDGSFINCRENIYEDSTGLVWFATPNSLVAYDGQTFIPFSHQSIEYPIPFSNVQLYNKNIKGHLLIATKEFQFYTFDPVQRKVISVCALLPTDQKDLIPISSNEETGSLYLQNYLLPDSYGGFYILIRKKTGNEYALYHSEDGSSISFVTDIKLKGITSMVCNDSTIFISDTEKIYTLDIENSFAVSIPYQINKLGSTLLLSKDKDDVWLFENNDRTESNFKKWDAHRSKFNRTPHSLDIALGKFHKFKCVENSFWLFGVKLLVEYSKETMESKEYFHEMIKSFEKMESPPLISHFTSINEHSYNVIWLSSGYGLVMVHQSDNSYGIELRSDSRFCEGYCSMRGIDIDVNNNLWLASYSGVFEKEETTILAIDTLKSVTSNGIYSLHTIQDYIVVNDILYHVTSESLEELIPGKQNGHVTNVVMPPNDIWMSTCFENGNQVRLFSYNLEEKSLVQIDLPERLRNSGQINDLVLSQDFTKLFLCTNSAGTYAYDLLTKTFNRLTKDSIKSDNDANHYNLIDNDSRLLIGSKNKVLDILLDGDNETDSLVVHTLPTTSDVHFFSAIDEDSTIMYGTNNGLVRFNKNQGSFEKLNLPGKIANEEFNRESCFKHPDGSYYFGSVNGVYILDADKLTNAPKPYDTSIQLLSVQYLNGNTSEFETKVISIDAVQKLSFQHNDKMVYFKMVKPNFDRDARTYYSFLLDGFDQEWSPIQSSPEIRFTNLDPGLYTLYAKSGVNPETITKGHKIISFTINQAWYKTTLFRMFVFLLSISFCALLFWLRYKQLLKFELLRSSISKNLHDDVGTMLTGIAMQSELIETVATGEVKELAGGISKRSREAMHRMRDTVWAIDSRKDSSMDLKDRLLDYIQDVLPTSDLSYTFDSNIKSNTSQKLNPVVRQNIYLIAKESINNILKHSSTTKVDISLLKHNNHIKLTIQDYGDQKPIKTSGQGLKNLKERALKINAEYRFTHNGLGFQTTLVSPIT